MANTILDFQMDNPTESDDDDLEEPAAAEHTESDDDDLEEAAEAEAEAEAKAKAKAKAKPAGGCVSGFIPEHWLL